VFPSHPFPKHVSARFGVARCTAQKTTAEQNAKCAALESNVLLYSKMVKIFVLQLTERDQNVIILLVSCTHTHDSSAIFVSHASAY
jgi:hypothetical protein